MPCALLVCTIQCNPVIWWPSVLQQLSCTHWGNLYEMQRIILQDFDGGYMYWHCCFIFASAFKNEPSCMFVILMLRLLLCVLIPVSVSKKDLCLCTCILQFSDSGSLYRTCVIKKQRKTTDSCLTSRTSNLSFHLNVNCGFQLS